MTGEVVTKSEFAALTGVTCGRVSQWIAAKKIDGDALVGRGHRARIRVDVATAQLKRTLDVDQRLANGRAKVDGDAVPDTVEQNIKTARLAQIELSNAKAAAEARVRSGRYVKTDDARQEMGRVAARLMAVFESSLTEFANAVVASPPQTSRDALRTLRAAWRQIRVRQAKARGEEAAALPPLVEDEEDADGER